MFGSFRTGHEARIGFKAGRAQVEARPAFLMRSTHLTTRHIPTRATRNRVTPTHSIGLVFHLARAPAQRSGARARNRKRNRNQDHQHSRQPAPRGRLHATPPLVTSPPPRPRSPILRSPSAYERAPTRRTELSTSPAAEKLRPSLPPRPPTLHELRSPSILALLTRKRFSHSRKRKRVAPAARLESQEQLGAPPRRRDCDHGA